MVRDATGLTVTIGAGRPGRTPRPRSGSWRLPGAVVGRGHALLAVLALCLFAGACSIPRWPVEGTLTSGYGFRWRGWLPGVHRGVDIGVPTGTPVRAMAPGRVRFSGTMGGYGRVVWIEHGGAVMTVYGHLSEIRVEAGAPVRARQVVGLSGSGGNAGGPHLHFEVWRWGRQVDPVPLLGGFPAN